MSPLFVIMCLSAFIILVCMCAYYKHGYETLNQTNEEFQKRLGVLEKDASAASVPVLAMDFLQAFAAKHQFTLEELNRDEHWITSAFEYQGGNFICHCGADNDELLITFPGILELPYSRENYEKVRTICLNCTEQLRYTKVVYSYNAEKNQLLLSILLESIAPREDVFLFYLAQCFKNAQEVRNAIENPPSSEEQLFDSRREHCMLVQAEMAHEEKVFQEEHPDSKAPNAGMLAEYLSYLFDGEKVEDMLSLTVQNADGTTEINQHDKIADFDLLSAVIDDSGEDAVFRSTTPAVLTLDAVSNHYVFTLHPLESDKTMLSVRMTAVRTPHEYLQNYVPDATYVPEAVSMRLCYAKGPLPSSQREGDAELPTTSLEIQMRHGHELMQQKCYLQAIAVLSPLFRKLKSQFFNLADKDKERFFTLCFDLGYSYTDLHLYEKAFYYLDMANTCNRFDYSAEYINCLAEGRDVRVFRELARGEEAIAQQINDIDNDDDRGTEKMMEQRERLLNYYAFLMRRRGYSQINFGDLNSAEETFKSLLEHEGSKEYAEHELKYIEQLRNQ